MEEKLYALQVSAVCWVAADETVLVGTGANEVLRVRLQPEEAAVLSQGHAGGMMESMEGGQSAEPQWRQVASRASLNSYSLSYSF